MTTQPQTNGETTYTLADVQNALDQGKITDAQATEYRHALTVKQAADHASKVTQTAIANERYTAAIEAELTQYAEKLPELTDEGSDAFKKVKAEFDKLTKSMGYPEDRRTNLLAITRIYGPVGNISKRHEAEAETLEDGPSAGGKANSNGDDTPGPAKGMSARERKFYEHQIETGRVKDWAAANELVKKYGRPNLRQRMGARV